MEQNANHRQGNPPAEQFSFRNSLQHIDFTNTSRSAPQSFS